MDFREQKLPPNPYPRANPVSKLLFFWILPLFFKGYRKELECEDLYDVRDEDESKHLGDKLERYWEEELRRAKLNPETKPSLLRALIKLSWRSFTYVTIFYSINQNIIMVSQPVFLRLLILTFNEKEVDTSKAYMYAALLSLSVFLQPLTIHPSVYRVLILAMKLRVAVSMLIYRKCLKLSKSAQNKTNSGQIVNLLSNDCTRFDTNLNFLPFVFSAPIQFCILMYLLYSQVGPACVAGIAFVVVLLPLQYFIGKYSAIFRLLIARKTDERGRFMNEIIIGMRVIKQYTWEKPFSVLIDGIRKLEVHELRKRGYLRGLHSAMITFSPKLIQYLTFLVFVLLEDEPMTADKVFFALSILHMVTQSTIHFTPQAAAGLGETIVALRRIQEFLLLDEQKTNNNLVMRNPSKIIRTGDDDDVDKIERKQTSVTMTEVSAKWTDIDVRPTLDKVSFSVTGDSLVMVVGPVGSSKTSLLHAIIDELPISSGALSIQGRVSYASQEPWIFAGNIFQNILFGEAYDENRYRLTLKACALEEDLRQLPYGDNTIVGERGVALSGGQKARVNLARALYRKADIYLLDDPLSAVDTRVSRHLFEKCVKEYLRGYIRILVTHQLQYLPQADHIIVLNQGRIMAQGTFTELVQRGIDFVSLMSSGDEDGPSRKASREENNNNNNQSKEGVAGNEWKKRNKESEMPEENIEKKVEGSVTSRTYLEYFLSGHSYFGFFALFAIFILCQLCTSGNDYWLSYWTNAEAKRIRLEKNETECSDPNDKACEDTYLGENTYLYVYTGFVVAVTVLNSVRGMWFYNYCARISVDIHDKMFRSMVRAPIKFFDDNPSGRIMNRFTKDIGAVDELLPPAFVDTLTIFLQVLGVICVVIISNYYMSVPAVGLFIVLFLIRKLFIETARDLKRIESITRSPVFTHVSATIQGLTTIRACKSQSVLIQQFEGHQNIHSSSWFLFIAANRCFGIWLELISNGFLVLVAFGFIIISSSAAGGNVGLAISSLLTMMGTFQWGMRQSAETENFMTSVERALEYSKLTPEAELESRKDLKPPPEWPDKGQVEFRNVSLEYEKGNPVLKNLNFKILPSEKIGIVGRTGAGKSSISNALFRLTEPSGEIWIDGRKINDIGLHELRRNISIIPQDPVLFSGSVRYNLDPFNQFDDNHLWRVIEEVELKDAVPSLDYTVADGGSNFSVGQRQLVCLARALLRNNKILLMDEATANVDPRTDSLIQETIRSKFASCTIITIAHRLHSIIDCDRILVLDHGSLMEYDHPHVLLQKEDGIFHGMIAQTGPSTSSMLKKMALQAYQTKFPGIHQETL